jgi:hypothetical protein
MQTLKGQQGPTTSTKHLHRTNGEHKDQAQSLFQRYSDRPEGSDWPQEDEKVADTVKSLGGVIECSFVHTAVLGNQSWVPI